MATQFDDLSDWGKYTYMDISGKMIGAGVRSDKFEDGMLKKSSSLGQWLIKELVRSPSLLPTSTLSLATPKPSPLQEA